MMFVIVIFVIERPVCWSGTDAEKQICEGLNSRTETSAKAKTKENSLGMLLITITMIDVCP